MATRYDIGAIGRPACLQRRRSSVHDVGRYRLSAAGRRGGFRVSFGRPHRPMLPGL
ncbi:hypothetical protein [Streptomyces glaucescens]